MPFDKIDQKDINENLKTAGTMKKSLDAAVKEKDDLLRLFRTELKKLEGSEESLASMVKNSFSVCDYQETLKKQIEGNKIDPKLERDVNRRIKDFEDKVARDFEPAFEKELKKFETFLDEFKQLLK
ncbi:MAG TPA: hypothetical protein VNE67_01250 [Acetobacteraceae bacterium]|nr:hypothetical protein [Acetobacteraceae bacterium]